MTDTGKNQYFTMRWIIFYVFLVLYVTLVIFTILAVFFNTFELPPEQEQVLFYAFITEIGAAIVALFYSLFEIHRKKPANGGTGKERLT
jgi:magnesium-transporting ATPase (P-type)